MMLVRGLAMKISGAVVRYASPGCKEWADGLAREVGFVEGDWAALWWALGSARVLFDYREAPIRSLAEVPAVARRLAESQRRGNGTWIFASVYSLISADRFLHTVTWLERAGCGLTVLGWISVATVVFLEWRKRLEVAPADDVIALVQFYRDKLERVRDLSRSPRSWIAGFGFSTLCVGLMLGERGGVKAHRVWVGGVGLLWAGAMLLFVQARRINRRRLERLDALLAEGGGGKPSSTWK